MKRALDYIALHGLVLAETPAAILFANDLRPRGEWLPLSLIKRSGCEAVDGTVEIRITRALAAARGLA